MLGGHIGSAVGHGHQTSDGGEVDDLPASTLSDEVLGNSLAAEKRPRKVSSNHALPFREGQLQKGHDRTSPRSLTSSTYPDQGSDALIHHGLPGVWIGNINAEIHGFPADFTHFLCSDLSSLQTDIRYSDICPFVGKR